MAGVAQPRAIIAAVSEDGFGVRVLVHTCTLFQHHHHASLISSDLVVCIFELPQRPLHIAQNIGLLLCDNGSTHGCAGSRCLNINALTV